MEQAAPVTARRIISLWLPLATSSLLMSAEQPIINAGIARTVNPETALAGFAIAGSLANLLEAPILMMIGASAALSSDHAMVRLLRRFTIVMAIIVMSVHFLLAFTPLYDVVVRGWMGVPSSVADAVLPAFRILILWSLPTGIRRLHQGIIIRLRRTRIIGIGTICRVLVSIGLTVLTMSVLHFPGQVGGATVSAGAVIFEAVLITFWARRLFPELPEASSASMSGKHLLGFYLPLVMVSFMSIVAQPVIAASLARAPFPIESLAAWPTLFGLAALVAAICYPLQETSIALADRRESFFAVVRVGLTLGLVATGLLSLLAFTPLADVYFGQVIGLPVHLRAFTNSLLPLLTPYPLLLACEVMLRGFLIKQQRTGATRLAMGAYLVVLGTALIVGTAFQVASGVAIAAGAVLLAILSEITLLAWNALRVLQTMPRTDRSEIAPQLTVRAP